MPPERKRVVLGERAAWFSVPPDWPASRQEGHTRVVDPEDECCVEASFIVLPPLLPGAPNVEARLRHALAESGHADAAQTSFDRGDIDIAWAEYDFESEDPHRVIRRPARGRWLIAANDAIQVLVTTYYWVDDESWAVPEWERIVATLELRGGAPLVADLAAFRS